MASRYLRSMSEAVKNGLYLGAIPYSASSEVRQLAISNIRGAQLLTPFLCLSLLNLNERWVQYLAHF
jgi:hypothetical protein